MSSYSVLNVNALDIRCFKPGEGSCEAPVPVDELPHDPVPLLGVAVQGAVQTVRHRVDAELKLGNLT